jgi:hypothetical protein
MLVHTCRCIFLIVLIGFYYKKKMITKKLFENVFGKLEIEKEKEMPLFSTFGLKARCCRSFAGPLGLINRQPSFSHSSVANWAGPIGRSRPQPCPFPSLADVWGPLVGAVFFLLLVTE